LPLLLSDAFIARADLTGNLVMADLGALLWPRTVALVGASAEPESLRGRIFNVMRGHRFAGALYPVSRSSVEVGGVKAYPSVADLPERADLAVIIIPAEHVPAELERCGKAGVRAAVILSSGFAEASGAAGSSLQQEIRAIARRYDMAVSGPNSEGFANIAAGLCPTFSPAMEASSRPLMPVGRERRQVAVCAQSGGMGFAFFDHGRAKELSFRYIVTTGNEACLETLDFAEFILDEGKTDALLLLLEDVKTAPSFQRVAEKALKAGKPIIVNKIGQSDAGVRAAASHTAALAGSYAAYRAMFQRYGIIEGADIGEMVDLAAGFLAWGHRLPAGRRVGICTASGGGGGWMADACAAAGLEVPVLDAATRARIDVHLPAYGTSQNPVDATAQAASRIGYAGLAELVLPSPAIDGLVVVMTGRNPHGLEKQKEALARLAETADKPILMWSYTLPAQRSVEILSEAGLPLYTDIGNCARTLRAMADYRAVRERFLRPIEARSAFVPDAPAARRLLASAGTALCEWEARPVLAAYGIGANPAGTLATSAAEAEAAAQKIAGPVAVKVQSPDILHKTEARAVRLGLRSAGEVRAAYEDVLAGARRHAPQARILGVLVQPMAPPGREVILGVERDATFGPMLMVGLGGVAVEVLKDVALAPVPLAAADARAMLARLKGAALLGAHRGAPPADVDALIELMVRLSRFAADHAETIAEIDLNPVIVHPQGEGVSVVDALIVKQHSLSPLSRGEG
jgi:acyl-CoA synthetase (NDP forming)